MQDKRPTTPTVASAIASAAGRNRKALYARAVELRDGRDASGGEGA